jgi:hypothetical protein
MQRNPYKWLAFGAVCLAFVFEVGTWSLGHEFTFFGKLSQQESAWVRYVVFTLAALLVIAALVYHVRRSPRLR